MPTFAPQMFNDAIFIKQHELFDGFDWVGLLQRRLTPPFSPDAPADERRSFTGFSLDVQKTSTPYKPEVLTSGCSLCPSKYDAEAWHDVFAGDAPSAASPTSSRGSSFTKG